MGAIKKISMNLPEDAFEVLQILATRQNSTMTDVVRRSIAVTKLLDDRQRAGDDILIRNAKSGEVERVIFAH